jgi:hypothetical protein
MAMTPDPSAIPVVVWVGGFADQAVPALNAVLTLVVACIGVVSFLLAASLVAVGLRRV